MMALWLCSVPKLSSSDAVCVVILPETPEILYSRSPSSCTELYRIRQLSSNRPFSSSGSSSAIADSAYKLTIRWPAFRAVSRTYSFSSASAFRIGLMICPMYGVKSFGNADGM
uniref:Putative secreted protein n=1 Tax=Anopheles darlingi TaxID=43151 RepID=A0A2M4D248_ANODA